jgi:iron(III) transport system ATP-binding protein
MLVADNLWKTFDAQAARVQALRGVSFEAPEGCFFTLLGPSGCGKSTTLRCVAGLETPTEGRIAIDGEPVFDAARRINLPPQRRQLGMVFQSYAIWPHMNVFENVAYPLRCQPKPPPESQIRQAVEDILERVGLEGYSQRSSVQLSGGQQQRLAFARALVSHPKLLLLDEPLSNLDRQVRETLRAELKQFRREFGLTFIYVTHDQTEALSMSDWIAVLDKGEVVQLGEPREIYERPRSEFVATFIGKTNIVRGTVVKNGDAGAPVVRTDFGQLHVRRAAELGVGSEVVVCVRPEDISIASSAESADASGVVRRQDYLGEVVVLEVECGPNLLTIREHPSTRTELDETVHLRFDVERAHLIAR